MKKFTKEWLKAALDDLITIEEIVKNSFLSNIVAFHAQQCVEKSMKAIIEEEQIDIPKIHKLLKLYKKVSFKLDNIDENILITLDGLYIESRYPSAFGLLPYGKPTLEDAKMFYEFANDIFDKVCNILDVDKKELKG